MISDKSQKRLAIKFCAAQGVVPFVEVVVRSQTGVEETPVDITEIDVLGLELGRSGTVQRVLFDCKTGSKLSPVNRSLWAAGLRTFVNAERVFVIQKRDVPFSHKLAASSLNVSIHSEDTFVKYANSITIDFSKDVTYLDNLDIWDIFLGVGRAELKLVDLRTFVTTQAALERSGPKGIRLGLSALIKAAPELDPSKALDCFLFANVVSAFLVFLSLSSTALKDLFQFSMDKQDFERTVRYFVWEGRENYENRRNMKAAIDRAKGDASPENFELPEWERFLQLIRSFLDAPESLASLPFLMKEIAFRIVTPKRADPDNHLRQLFSSNNRARQFIFACATYLVHATKLPKQFLGAVETEVNGLLAPLASDSVGGQTQLGLKPQ